jgi:hypothetical protein
VANLIKERNKDGKGFMRYCHINPKLVKPADAFFDSVNLHRKRVLSTADQPLLHIIDNAIAEDPLSDDDVFRELKTLGGTSLVTEQKQLTP